MRKKVSQKKKKAAPTKKSMEVKVFRDFGELVEHIASVVELSELPTLKSASNQVAQTDNAAIKRSLAQNINSAGAPQLPQVADQLNRLHAAFESLQQGVKSLQDRLSSVLGEPHNQIGSPSVSQDGLVPLASQICFFANLAGDLIDQVNDLSSRIEI